MPPLTFAALLSTTTLTPAQNVLPTGDNVRSGAASIGQASSGRLTITQSSPRAVIDWNSFSVRPVNSVTFNQTGVGSAVLNRVGGSAPSTIAGKLQETGQVFLVNPNEIAITKSGTVNVGGGFVGSTLGITTNDFNSGKFTFQCGGDSAAVSNAGVIRAAPGGFVGWLGGQVTNAGAVVASVGSIGLGAGEAATLDLAGDKFLQVVVQT